jgi:hypothetical protein
VGRESRKDQGRGVEADRAVVVVERARQERF